MHRLLFSALSKLQLIHSLPCSGRYYYYPHFTAEEAEGQGRTAREGARVWT